MQKKTLLIVLLCLAIISVSLLLSVTWFRNKQAVSMPRTAEKVSKEVPMSQTPKETLKEIIKKNIKQEFLPPVYKITHTTEHLVEALGDDVEHYYAEWDIDRIRFSAFIGFSNSVRKKLIGYGVLIFVKEPGLSGKELGDRFLNFLPTEKWSHQVPAEGRGKLETFTAISTIDHSKVYACIALFNFPGTVFFQTFPDEPAKKVGIIAYGVSLPSKFEYLQNSFAVFCPKY